MELHGGSWWSKPWLWFGSGQGELVPVLSTGLLVAQLAQQPAQNLSHRGLQPAQLLPCSDCFSNRLWFGAADSSASVHLSRFLQGPLVKTSKKVWTSLPPPAASNTQSWWGLREVYAFSKGNGERIAGRSNSKTFGNSAVPCIWKICCPPAYSSLGCCLGNVMAGFPQLWLFLLSLAV